MRRIIVIVCGCCIVGLTATAAQSQQSGQRKPGILGRILGLKTVPNAQKVMQGNQEVQSHEQQQRTESRQLRVGPRMPFARRRIARARANVANSVAPIMQVRPASADTTSLPTITAAKQSDDGNAVPGVIHRVTSNNGRTVSSFTVPTGGVPAKATTRSTRAANSSSLARVLRNRQSQPLNEVTREVRRMRNPFVPNRGDVYQPIASGPVPMPETLLVEDESTTEAPVVPPLSVPAIPTVASEQPSVEVVDMGNAKPEIGPILKSEVAVAEPELPKVETETPNAGVALPVAVGPKQPTLEPAPAVVAEEPAVAKTNLKEQFVLPRQVSADQLRWRRSSRSVVETRPSVADMHPVRRADQQPALPAASVTRPTVPARQVSRTEPARPAETTRPATVAINPEPKPAEPTTARTVPEVVTQPSQPVARVSVPQRQVRRPVPRIQQTPVAPQQQRQVVRTQQLPRILGRANTGGLPVIRPKGHRTAMPAVTPSATAQYETVLRATRRTEASVQPQRTTPQAMPRREPASIENDAPGRVLLFPQSSLESEPASDGPTAMKAPTPEPKAQPATQPETQPEESLRTEQVIQPASRKVDAADATSVREAIRPAVRTRTASVIGPARPKHIDARAQRMQAVADRPHLLGFKGFCPVELRDHRRLIDSGLEFYASYRNRTYYFSSERAKVQFEKDPKRYVPAADGRDVVLLTHTGVTLQGKLDYAAWYQNRLFLFTSKKALHAFNCRPNMYADRL